MKDYPESRPKGGRRGEVVSRIVRREKSALGTTPDPSGTGAAGLHGFCSDRVRIHAQAPGTVSLPPADGDSWHNTPGRSGRAISSRSRPVGYGHCTSSVSLIMGRAGSRIANPAAQRSGTFACFVVHGYALFSILQRTPDGSGQLKQCVTIERSHSQCEGRRFDSDRLHH